MERMDNFTPKDEDKMNRKHKKELDNYLNTMDSDGEDIKENKKGTNIPNKSVNTEIKSTIEPIRIVEALDVIKNMIINMNEANEDDLGNTPVADDSINEDKDILERLNKLYTPTLISQKFENDIADNANNELQNSGNLNKRTMINFDKKARVAQLISACAMLIAEKKNSPKWQMLLKADAIKNQTKLDIQKEEYSSAIALAQRYLIMVSTTNNSSVARAAAQELIPETQH